MLGLGSEGPHGSRSGGPLEQPVAPVSVAYQTKLGVLTPLSWSRPLEPCGVCGSANPRMCLWTQRRRKSAVVACPTELGGCGHTGPADDYRKEAADLWNAEQKRKNNAN